MFWVEAMLRREFRASLGNILDSYVRKKNGELRGGEGTGGKGRGP